MAKFLKGNALNASIEKIFDDCEKELIIVSPFIKLHNRFINALKAKKHSVWKE
jgi:UDP-N-acetylmuramoylalanine-D-glutamate ligase